MTDRLLDLLLLLVLFSVSFCLSTVPPTAAPTDQGYLSKGYLLEYKYRSSCSLSSLSSVTVHPFGWCQSFRGYSTISHVNGALPMITLVQIEYFNNPTCSGQPFWVRPYERYGAACQISNNSNTYDDDTHDDDYNSASTKNSAFVEYIFSANPPDFSIDGFYQAQYSNDGCLGAPEFYVFLPLNTRCLSEYGVSSVDTCTGSTITTVKYGQSFCMGQASQKVTINLSGCSNQTSSSNNPQSFGPLTCLPAHTPLPGVPGLTRRATEGIQHVSTAHSLLALDSLPMDILRHLNAKAIFGAVGLTHFAMALRKNNDHEDMIRHQVHHSLNSGEGMPPLLFPDSSISRPSPFRGYYSVPTPSPTASPTRAGSSPSQGYYYTSIYSTSDCKGAVEQIFAIPFAACINLPGGTSTTVSRNAQTGMATLKSFAETSCIGPFKISTVALTGKCIASSTNTYSASLAFPSTGYYTGTYLGTATCHGNPMYAWRPYKCSTNAPFGSTALKASKNGFQSLAFNGGGCLGVPFMTMTTTIMEMCGTEYNSEGRQKSVTYSQSMSLSDVVVKVLKGLSTGAIIGIAVGGGVVLVLIGVVIYFKSRQSKVAVWPPPTQTRMIAVQPVG